MQHYDIDPAGSKLTMFLHITPWYFVGLTVCQEKTSIWQSSSQKQSEHVSPDHSAVYTPLIWPECIHCHYLTNHVWTFLVVSKVLPAPPSQIPPLGSFSRYLKTNKAKTWFFVKSRILHHCLNQILYDCKRLTWVH